MPSTFTGSTLYSCTPFDAQQHFDTEQASKANAKVRHTLFLVKGVVLSFHTKKSRARRARSSQHQATTNTGSQLAQPRLDTRRYFTRALSIEKAGKQGKREKSDTHFSVSREAFLSHTSTKVQPGASSFVASATYCMSLLTQQGGQLVQQQPNTRRKQSQGHTGKGRKHSNTHTVLCQRSRPPFSLL